MGAGRDFHQAIQAYDPRLRPDPAITHAAMQMNEAPARAAAARLSLLLVASLRPADGASQACYSPASPATHACSGSSAAPPRSGQQGRLVQAVMGAWLQRGFFPLPQSRCCATRDLPTLGGSVVLRLQSHPLRRARFSTREAPPCRRRRRRRSITLHAPIDRTPAWRGFSSRRSRPARLQCPRLLTSYNPESGCGDVVSYLH